MKGKCIILSAPSGSGKSTIVKYLMTFPQLKLKFSVSATSRPPRGKEQDGVEYFFITTDEFKDHIQKGDFLEYEEVYGGSFYGTLRQQVEDKLEDGFNVAFDIDVVGGCNIKKHYGDKALSIFIQPPSIDELRRRLIGRGTDSMEKIEERLAKAAFEMTFAPRFDKVIINDDLATAQAEALQTIKDFLSE